ncbi:MAG: cytidylate kinase-like family protein [Ruminococcaceae bacterium]|nr:cytidylate kinase-like family protein [Oscillospiraceae bacterium]
MALAGKIIERRISMAEKLAITIGRQFGSGGRDIGVRVGELLGIKVYDKELLIMAAEKRGISPDYLRRVDEKAASSLLYTLAMGSSIYSARHLGVDVPINDQLFITQTEIIKEAAEAGTAIFIGRCADYVLRNHPHRLSFFIYSDYESRVHRVMERHECGRSEAESLINKTDKKRINYYNFYTGKKWGKFENYHMSLDSSLLGVEGTAQMIANLIKIYSSETDDERKIYHEHAE